MTNARRLNDRALVLWLLPLLATLAGCDARFERPGLLWALWLAPALVVFFIWSGRARRRLLERFGSPAVIGRIEEGASSARRRLRATLLVASVGLLALAMAGFQYGFTWQEIRRRGVDVVVALDVSESMLVQDAAASDELTRIERARREIADLLRLMKGDRVALVAFAGTAFLELPLTLDYSAAELFLDDLDTELMPVQGTDLGEALRVSLDAFELESEAERAIILITDGENHEGGLDAMLEQVAAAEVRVFAIGIGQDSGAPIPRPGGGFRRDARGEMILSRLDEPTLQRLALETGGRYVRSVTGDLDLEEIYLEGIKATLAEADLETRRRKQYEDRFQWLVGAALLFLMLGPLIPEGRRVRGRERRGVRQNEVQIEEVPDVAA